MTTKISTIQHLFIIDTSVRSYQEKSNLISRVNDSLDSIRLVAKRNYKQAQKITIMSIKDNQIKCMCHDLDITETNDFSIGTITLNEPVQLFDAIGTGIATWRALAHKRTDSIKHQVSLFTSGKDFGSRKYSICTLKSIITSLTTIGWQFTLIGRNPLLSLIASNLGIHNYYNCSAPQSYRERNFLISRLKKQWQLQQIKNHPDNHAFKAA